MILLSRNYAGYLSGTIVQLQTSEEAALVAQGLATVSAGPVSTGAVTTTKTSGRVAIAASGTSVVVTSTNFDVNSKFAAYLSNSSADTTALYITRIVPAAGSVTFVLNAASTAAVSIDWSLQLLGGETAVAG